MRIKPECDVETAEDFAKYYQHSFMESRDGRILRVTGHHGRNIVLRDFNYPENDEERAYTMLPWRQVRTDLVYGRPPSTNFMIHDKVYIIYMSNNRQSGRGFRADYYGFFSPRRKEMVSWKQLAGESVIAEAVFRPEYVGIEEALARASKGKDSLLDSRYSVLGHSGVIELWRGTQCVGSFANSGQGVLLKKTGRFAEHSLRYIFNYKGDIEHAKAA